MRAKAHWGVVVALAAPAPTWALGFGDIELFSALNQPFRAEIGLNATAEELDSLRVTVADRAVFEAAGLDRPSFMSDLRFDVTRNAAGRNVVSVTSVRSVAEPFVTMIIEATTSSGQLRREFTVFLDPPVLLNSPQSAAPITAPRSGGQQPGQPSAAIRRETPVTPPPAARAEPAPAQAAPVAPAPRESVPVQAPRTAASGDSYGPIQRAETLWAIASRYRPAGATMNQTMLAIYDANRGAFGDNINSLRVGAILRIPPSSELTTLSVAAANEEARRQNAAWRGGSAGGSVTQGDRVVLVPPSPESVSAGGGATAPGGEQPEIAALQGELSALREQLAERDRLIDLQSTELANLQNQLAAIDGVTDAAADAAPPQADEAADAAVFADETAAEAAAAAAAASEAAAAAEAQARQPVVEETAPARNTTSVSTSAPAQPGLIDRIIGWASSWITLVVAGVAAILLAALWFMRRREEEVEDVTGHWDALEAGMDEPNVPSSVGPISAGYSARESIETALAGGDPFIVEEQRGATSTTLPIDDAEEIAADHYAQATTEPVSTEDTLSSSQVMNLDEADPVAEADFHMAYGLYDQAAELLSKELQASPGRRDLRLKLLEVFFVWGNKEEFLDAATHLREQIGDGPDPDWDKVLIMGKQICPNAALFAAAASGSGSVDVSLGETDSDSLDFAFEDMPEPDSINLVDVGEATNTDLSADGTIDLDLTGNRPSLLSDTSAGLQDATGTLNIGADTAASLEAALFEDSDAYGDDATAPVDPEETLGGRFSTDDTLATPGRGSYAPDQPTMASSLDDEEATQLQSREFTAGNDEYVGGTQELPTMDHVVTGGESTEEIDVHDLGLDVSDLEDFGIDDIGAELDRETGDTREQLALDDSAELLSATGITQVLSEQSSDDESEDEDEDDDDQTQLRAASTLFSETAINARAHADTEVLETPGSDVDEFDLDLGDLEAALADDDTIEEQHDVEAVDFGFSEDGTGTPIDLDVGAEFLGDEDPTGSEDVRAGDPQTLTEVGTKLDLARAYIDMGDPDGARSILEEVLSEGDTTQRTEAQSLIDAISA